MPWKFFFDLRFHEVLQIIIFRQMTKFHIVICKT